VDTENLQRYLESFGKQVVNRAKGNLQKAKGGKTKLEQTIRFEIVETADGFTVQFYMADYGVFVDKGVSGTKVKRTFTDTKGNRVASPFSYTTKQPPSRVLDKWIVRKGIAPRDKQGKFISRKSISFLIARSIFKKGIQGLSFFQKPLMLGLKEFGKEMLGAVKVDIINELKTAKYKSKEFKRIKTIKQCQHHQL
jgi:hypothetical protein